MSIVPFNNIKVYLNIDKTDNSKDILLGFIHDGVEDYAAKALARTLENTTYSEKYNGSGTTTLLLDQYPVTAIQKVSISFQDVIKVKNTSSDVDNCYVTADTDSLLLTISGGTNDGTDDLTFASYATLSTIVAAINAVAKGWDAAIMDTDYNDLKTTSLLEVYNLPCGAPGGKTATYQYLYWGLPVHVTLDAKAGIIHYSGGFPKGFQNVLANYTAGYAAASMPASIQFAIMETVKAIYTRRGEDGEGVASFSSGGLTVKYLDVLVELEKKIEGSVDSSKFI